jgi:glutathione synthase/RimK-type ligase-like ATP-grasp enzyme
MTRVAIVTCAGSDVDPDSPVLVDALRDVGVDAHLEVWDDDGVVWADYDLNVVRSTWDYTDRRDEFLDWAKRVERLENPFSVITYSSDKHYLADLQARGHTIVPSHFCDVGFTPVFPSVDFVVKPCVGAGSRDAERYRSFQRDEARAHVEALHRRGRDVLIQPYVTSVDEVGELALIFIDGDFAHAMLKGAMLNTPAPERHHLFRHEQMSTIVPDPKAVAFAIAMLQDLGLSELLYARVDLVALEEGWAVMEVELVEPSLFLSYEERTVTALAAAIKRRAAR